MSNLINNAFEAYPNKQGAVKISFQEAGTDVSITVEDQGKGIPKDVLSKIGLKSVSFEKEGGRGLGLYHAVRSVRAWGGTVKLDSEPNVGTSVQITLPRAQRVNI